mgnify:CR=1 FL=1
MVYSDFNNVCHIQVLIWSLLETPKKHWRGFAKLSMTKRINLGENNIKANSLLHTVAYSDNTTHFAIILVQVGIRLLFHPTAGIETVFMTTRHWKIPVI